MFGFSANKAFYLAVPFLLASCQGDLYTEGRFSNTQLLPDAGNAEPLWNQRLFIPPVLSGTQFQLNVAPSTKEFFPGTLTNTYGINGDYLGPTLVMRQGDTVRLDVINNLNEMTTMHWHGLHVPAEEDGGPHTMVASGATWSPEFTVLNEAGTYWYHPHPHGNTTPQVSLGLAGLIIVQDAHESSLSLPRTYGVDDIPLIVQDKDFTATRAITSAEMGDTMVVNGQINAIADVPAQMVRFRVLNASNTRAYNFGMSDGRTFRQIAGDGGLLTRPVPVTRVRLSPGERAEFVVDFSQDQGKELGLMSYAAELRGGIIGGPGSPPGPGSTLHGITFQVMRIAVGERRANRVTALPSTLISRTIWPAESAVKTRRINMIRTLDKRWTFEGLSFDMNRIDHTVNLGDTEIWEIYNQTPSAHPFHIHDISFYVLDRGGRAPAEVEKGPKDTILVMPSQIVRIIAKFENFADPDTPYMYHCHMLLHEDHGMMGQFVVVDPNAPPPPPAGDGSHDHAH